MANVIEYFTALVISYTVENYEIDTVMWFQTEKHCTSAMNSGSADGLYNHLYDLYGNDIMMVCQTSNTVSKKVKPKLRPW